MNGRVSISEFGIETVIYRCPECGQTLSRNLSAAGSIDTCAKCSIEHVVPLPSESAAHKTPRAFESDEGEIERSKVDNSVLSVAQGSRVGDGRLGRGTLIATAIIFAIAIAVVTLVQRYSL